MTQHAYDKEIEKLKERLRRIVALQAGRATERQVWRRPHRVRAHRVKGHWVRLITEVA